MELNTVFQTDRLTLRPLRLDDAHDLHVFTGDPEAMRFIGRDVLSYEATLEGLRRNLATRFPEMLPLRFRAVVLKTSGRVIGNVGLHHLENVDGNPVEITYHLARPYWGKGYATEAARRLVRHGFEDMGLNEIVAAVNPANVGSVRVAEKLGLRLRKRIEWPDQGLVDLYAVTRQEYENRHRRAPKSRSALSGDAEL
jgi:ribosomal-protein-alanine N-acetyltransferase